MPAVENPLGPCRKPKSTIYGWTRVSSLRSSRYIAEECWNNGAGSIGLFNTPELIDKLQNIRIKNSYTIKFDKLVKSPI
jgi:hypothetical protein